MCSFITVLHLPINNYCDFTYTYNYSNPAMGMDESLTVEGLSVLSEVREVDGYVHVENTNQEDLTNLR